MVPVPEVVSPVGLNAMIEQWEEEDEPFEAGRPFSLRVDRFSQISVRTHRCSVPVRLIGPTVRAMLHVSELVVYDGRREVAPP